MQDKKPHADQRPDPESRAIDEDTQRVVRQMMAEAQRDPVGQDLDHVVKRQDRPHRADFPAAPQEAEATGHDHAAADGNDPTTGGWTLHGVIERIRQVRRPRPKTIFWAVVAVVMLWKPWLIPGLILVTVWVGLITYFTLGPDRISDLIGAGWERFEARRPEAAGRVLARIQRLADRADGGLARLPERWTDGIYLPDLGRSQVGKTDEATRPDPFERLAKENLQSRAAARRA